MLCCPARSPFSASSRLPGGTRKSFKRPAISNCRSLRRATDAIFANRLTGSPFDRDGVSAHLNVLITKPIVTYHVINVKRDYTRVTEKQGMLKTAFICGFRRQWHFSRYFLCSSSSTRAPRKSPGCTKAMRSPCTFNCGLPSPSTRTPLTFMVAVVASTSLTSRLK